MGMKITFNFPFWTINTYSTLQFQTALLVFLLQILLIFLLQILLIFLLQIQTNFIFIFSPFVFL